MASLFSALKFGILKSQHVTVFLHCTLQSIIETSWGLRLNLDGDLYFHART